MITILRRWLELLALLPLAMLTLHRINLGTVLPLMNNPVTVSGNGEAAAGDVDVAQDSVSQSGWNSAGT